MMILGFRTMLIRRRRQYEYMDMLEIFILRKLYAHRIIGERYKPVEWLMAGLPPAERDMTRIHKAVKRLHNLGYLVPHKKGTTWSLNPRRRHEVARM